MYKRQSLEDAENQINPIPNPEQYQNITNPQTVWANVVNDTSLCVSEVVGFDLFVEPLPYTNLGENQGVCVDPFTGQVLEPFTIDGTVETPVAGTDYSYQWTIDGVPVSTEPEITVDQGGIYQVTITADGPLETCSYIAEALYEAVSTPIIEASVIEASFNLNGDYTIEVTVVEDFGNTNLEFAIDDGPFQSSTTFTNVTAGTHTVFARVQGVECSLTSTELGIIDYPRFFTPNNDGFHDTWNITGIGAEPNLDAKIFIFDRFGKLLKQLSPTSQGWDGTFNGQPMPSNDYWFRVDFTEPDAQRTQRTFTAHFTLKR